MKMLNVLFVLFTFLSSPLFLNAQPLKVLRTSGEGRTTGHVVTTHVKNTSRKPVVYHSGPIFIPGNQQQSYLIPESVSVVIPPKSEVAVPRYGYCTNVFVPPLAAGRDCEFTPLEVEGIPDDLVAGNSAAWTAWPGMQDFVLTYPGTDEPLKHYLDYRQAPQLAGDFLYTIVSRLIETTRHLQDNGQLQTVLSSDQENELETLVQYETWVLSAYLSGKPFSREDFERGMENNLRVSQGIDLDQTSEEFRTEFQEGTQNVWDAMGLIGFKAGVAQAGPGQAIPISVNDCDCGRISFRVRIRNKTQNKDTVITVDTTFATIGDVILPTEEGFNESGDSLIITLEEFQVTCVGEAEDCESDNSVDLDGMIYTGIRRNRDLPREASIPAGGSHQVRVKSQRVAWGNNNNGINQVPSVFKFRVTAHCGEEECRETFRVKVY